jgi:hypothetical protein
MMTSPSPWGQRALKYATQLTEIAFGRGSATKAEAQAAEYVKARLNQLGNVDVATQHFAGLRSIWYFFALTFGLALSGHLAYWLLRDSAGDLPAAALTLPFFAFAAFLLWRKFTFQEYPLRQILPHGPSQNVIAALPPKGDVRNRVVLTGHLDSHQAVFWYANDILVTIYALAAPVIVFGTFLAPSLYLLLALTGWSPLRWLTLFLAGMHGLAWVTSLSADFSSVSPGANDNASAVGTVLALGERLRQQPLEHTEVWLAFTGCEESGADGMIHLLQQEGEMLQDALMINFELVGIGERLVYLQSEGVLRKQKINPDVERLVKEVGQAFDLETRNGSGTGVFTETGVVWEHGFDGVCFLAQRSDSILLPEWHRPSDTPDRLQADTLDRVHDLTWALLQKVDKEY